MKREARVHPRKYAVVSLAEGCVAEATSAPLKKTHDTETPAECHLRTYAVYTRPPPPRLPPAHTENPSIEGRGGEARGHPRK